MTKYITEYMKKYRLTKKWKKYHTEYIRKWREKNGTRKDNMRRKVRRKVLVGQIKKLPCEVCGEIKVEAHHDDYRSHLKIVWLCQPHHRQRDVLMGKRKN